MAKKQKSKIAKLYCYGRNYENVTASYSLLEYDRDKVLVDFGTHQTSDIFEQYRLNNENLRFSAKELQAVIISHCH